MIGETVPTPEPRSDAIPADDAPAQPEPGKVATEIGGRDGPDPTRYGDWEKNGRCIDF
jgi:hypothetical protein